MKVATVEALPYEPATTVVLVKSAVMFVVEVPLTVKSMFELSVTVTEFTEVELIQLVPLKINAWLAVGDVNTTFEMSSKVAFKVTVTVLVAPTTVSIPVPPEIVRVSPSLTV